MEITGCSESGLNFTLTENLNINSQYTFLAACKDNDGTCVSENLSGTDDILIYKVLAPGYCRLIIKANFPLEYTPQWEALSKSVWVPAVL